MRQEERQNLRGKTGKRKGRSRKIAEAGKKELEQARKVFHRLLEEEAQKKEQKKSGRVDTHNSNQVCGTGNQLNALGEFLTKTTLNMSRYSRRK